MCNKQKKFKLFGLLPTDFLAYCNMVSIELGSYSAFGKVVMGPKSSRSGAKFRCKSALFNTLILDKMVENSEQQLNMQEAERSAKELQSLWGISTV